MLSMNCPEVVSYLNVVCPVVMYSSTSSTDGLFGQLTFFRVTVSLIEMSVSSVDPAKTSNFSGTVEPALIRLYTPLLSTG